MTGTELALRLVLAGFGALLLGVLAFLRSDPTRQLGGGMTAVVGSVAVVLTMAGVFGPERTTQIIVTAVFMVIVLAALAALDRL